MSIRHRRTTRGHHIAVAQGEEALLDITPSYRSAYDALPCVKNNASTPCVRPCGISCDILRFDSVVHTVSRSKRTRKMTFAILGTATWWIFGFGALSVLFLSKVWNIGRRPADIPPGPPTIPILGNLHQMPIDKPHIQLQKWAAEYGYVRCFYVDLS